MATHPDEDEHDHVFGPVETSRFAGTPHRKCQVADCRFITLDLEDEGEEAPPQYPQHCEVVIVKPRRKSPLTGG